MINFSLLGMPEDMKNVVKAILDNHWRNSFSATVRVNIHFNHDKSLTLNTDEMNVLLLWESEVVMPEQYRNKILERYNLVIPFNKDRANRLGLPHYLNHPYDFTLKKIQSIEPQKLIAFVNAKKFSAISRSLYGFRRKGLVEISNEGIQIEIFGPNWNESRLKEFRERLWALRRAIKARKFPDFSEAFSEFGYEYKNYLGPMEEKGYSLPNYKYTLIIENDIDSVTEKVFEAIECHSVPIYIGASLQDFADLQKCVIQVQPDNRELLKVVDELSDQIYVKQISFVKDFLDRESQDKIEFSSEHNWKKLAEIIDSYLADRPNVNFHSGN
jgi:hypothetical protein